MMNMINNPDISSYITYPRAVKILKEHGINTAFQLAEFFPKKYIDYRVTKTAKECTDGEYAVFTGRLLKIEKRTMKGNVKREYIYGKLVEKTGTEIKIFMFGNLFLFDYYAQLKNTDVAICGKITLNDDFGYTITQVDDMMSEDMYRPHFKTQYKKFAGISEEKMKEYIKESLRLVTEPLEPQVCESFHLPDYTESLMQLHFPNTEKDINIGKRRLLFNDLLYFALMMDSTVNKGTNQGVTLASASTTVKFIHSLPFTLTKDQKEVLGIMINAAKQGKRNNILLQGDVGCGKTIVAACMMMCAAENGFQSVLMAPRMVLAQQHYQEIAQYAKMMGKECVFLHSGMKAKEKKESYQKIADGSADFIIGTHSCIADDVVYHNLGVVITDEEHLFGVAQKEKIKEKANEGLHYISMSATPIPRTVAEVLYGDSKEILCIKEKPAGRKDIITRRVDGHEELFLEMEKEIAKGHQCYVVCPAIEEDDENGLISLEEAERDYKKYFQQKDINIGIVNGKQKKAETEEIMEGFQSGKYKILLSTTVIEVGVNNPNATIMVIEQAERFGLASLHQLRGRVGRSNIQSYCYLVSSDCTNERLKTMERTNDGFEIAEADLKQRGAGNLIGVEQSGVNYYVNKMISCPRMYESAKQAAKYCKENGYGECLKQIYSN